MRYTNSTSTGTTSTATDPYTGHVYYIHINAPPPPRPPAPPPSCPHRLLGVACDVEESELKRTYKRLAKAIHPDVGPTREKGARTQKMALINVAYDEARKQLPTAGAS